MFLHTAIESVYEFLELVLPLDVLDDLIVLFSLLFPVVESIGLLVLDPRSHFVQGLSDHILLVVQLLEAILFHSEILALEDLGEYL